MHNLISKTFPNKNPPSEEHELREKNVKIFILEGFAGYSATTIDNFTVRVSGVSRGKEALSHSLRIIGAWY